MRFQYFLFVLATLLFSSCQETEPVFNPPKLGGWDYEWMLQVKVSLSQDDNTYQAAISKVVEDADKALEEGTFTVTSKKMIPPSGSKHDYMSMGPYWWPDPEKSNGLPYIRRDGEVNPERDELDSSRKNKLINNVRSLALAWFFTDQQKYAEKAGELLSVWFLDKETLMNPHLEYAQAIPGRTPREIYRCDRCNFFSYTSRCDQLARNFRGIVTGRNRWPSQLVQKVFPMAD